MIAIEQTKARAPRRIHITPEYGEDCILKSFLACLNPEADIDVYAHHTTPTLKMTPHTEAKPSDHIMDDGRLAYVFHMGKPRPDMREYIVVVTSRLAATATEQVRPRSLSSEALR